MMSKRFIWAIIPLLCILALSFVHADLSSVHNYYKFDSGFRDESALNDCVPATEGGAAAVVYINGSNPFLGNGSLQSVPMSAHGLICGQGVVRSAMTISAWVYFHGGNNAVVSFDQNHTGDKGFALLYFNGFLELYVYNNGQAVWVANGTSGLENAWHMVTVTKDGFSQPTFYVDGVQVSTVTQTSGSVNESVADTSFQMRVAGFFTSGTTDYTDGLVDEVAVWNKVISSDDVQLLYNGGAGHPYPLSGGSADYPFSVKQVDTYKNKSIQQINANFTGLNDPFGFTYAVVCDATPSALWNEQFNKGYNGTDYLTSVNNISALLTADSLVIDIPGSMDDFYYEKVRATGLRENMNLILTYSTTNNISIDLVGLTDATDLGFYYRLQKLGSNLSIIEVIPGYNPATVASTTVGSNIAFQLHLIPQTISPNIQVFSIEFIVNNVTIGTSDTFKPGWTPSNKANIRNVQLFINSTGKTYLHSLGLYHQASAPTSGIDFFNSIAVTNDSGSFFTQAVVSSSFILQNNKVLGNGFYLIPGFVTNETINGYSFASIPLSAVTTAYPILSALDLVRLTVNNISGRSLNAVGGSQVFFSECDYKAPGIYTQRHYMGGGVLDTSHYQDLIVTVSDRDIGVNGAVSVFDTTPGDASISGDGTAGTGTGSGDFATDLIPSFFNSLGFTSAASHFLIWFCLWTVIAIAIAVGVKAPFIGALVLVLGVIAGSLPGVGMVPLWVVIVFVLIAAGLGTIFSRNIFTGSSGS
jgi:hypothetical protein